MKKATLILLFVLATLTSFGQKIRFTDSTNVWRYYRWSDVIVGFIPYPENDTYFGDTIYHGTKYQKLTNSFFSGDILIREDTILKKVFAVDLFYDSIEQLLYNYNLNVGDTFKCHYAIHIVTSLDSVLINAIWHKTWHLEAVPGSTTALYEYYVVEGIGCLEHPCFPISPRYFESYTNITCFSTKSDTPALSRIVGSKFFNNTNSCTFPFPLKSNSIMRRNAATIIIPNPVNHNTKIIFPYNLSGSILVLNSIGQVIVNMPFTNEYELLIGDKITAPGIYYYRVTDERNGKVFSEKFVRQ